MKIRVFAKGDTSDLSRRLERLGRVLEISMIICFYFFSPLAHPAGVITGPLKGKVCSSSRRISLLPLHTFILHKGFIFTTCKIKNLNFLSDDRLFVEIGGRFDG